MRLPACLLGLVLCCSGFAAVPPDAMVDAVQMPAWLQRGYRQVPLVPGQEIRAGDRVLTGEGARAYLKLGEGSTVKLGASAQFTFSREAAEPALFKAAMNVLAGAFRFTTAEAQKLRRRDVAIRVGTATIGIRGTDVWGRSDSREDLVMLLEGRIEIQPARGEAIAMSEGKTVFTAPRGGVAAPLSVATDDEILSRARETDIVPGDGSVRAGGHWVLLLGSFAGEAAALATYDRARGSGYAARITIVAGQDGMEYRVLVPGFSDAKEAAATAARLRTATGIEARPLRGR